MKPNLPCALYTRKSSEEGLDQDFNSLHAQREACQAYVLSQKAEGWKALPEHYDDGGYSGGNMERPGLQRLLQDISAGKVTIVVVYKVDRLTRSLADFAKLVEQFDAQGVSFVSVTQQFNTTTSMGRLTLNVLLSFAQFEREVTGERIRDKIAASKKKGMWMGGFVPMGYQSHERTLQIDEAQAERIQTIFRLYLDLESVGLLKEELDRLGWTTPISQGNDQRATGGKSFSRGHLYRLLSNPIYLGKISHKGQIYPGNHPAIIDQDTWERVQARLTENRQGAKGRVSARSPSLLAGKIQDEQGERLAPTHAAKGRQRYRYYVSHHLIGKGRSAQGDQQNGLRIPAPELEGAVLKLVTDSLNSPNDLVADLTDIDALTCQKLIASARQQAVLFNTATDHERLRILGTLVERVVVRADRISVAINRSGLTAIPNQEPLPPITRSVDVQLRRSGFGIRLIVPAKGTALVRQVDQALLTFIRRGTHWFQRLIQEGIGPKAIAKTEGLSESLVQQMIYASFLAPDIVRLIERGEQPASLTSRALLRALPLPPRFEDQRKLFGIAA